MTKYVNVLGRSVILPRILRIDLLLHVFVLKGYTLKRVNAVFSVV